MLGALYDPDIRQWAEQQAALLRRVARSERSNDVDGDHVVEAIEDVGLSELSAARRMRIDGQLPDLSPDICPFTLDDLLSGDTVDLVARLGEGSGGK